MKHLLSVVTLLGVLLLQPLVHAQNGFIASPVTADLARPVVLRSVTLENKDTAAVRAWKRSVAPFVAAQVLDVVSSYGMRERNPLLAGADGRFGSKALTMKLGFTGAIVGVESLVVRKWPRLGHAMARMNWGGTVLTGSIAVHNFALR
jgi:hypothetical protein